ncbi:NAD(P)H-binding protein [Saccharomonospora sp. NPDC006951]
MRVVVAGSSGFVGRKLCPALEEAGHTVLAMTRQPEHYTGAGTAVYGDVHDEDSLRSALAGADAAYYLVHSLGERDFERQDAAAARAFAVAARDAGVRGMVYLGGLGEDSDELSAHLRSRRQVEYVLAAEGVPVTVLRAGIIIGHGGISWEITRQLVENLPVMVTPRWVGTRAQPIAVADVVRYLVAVLGEPAASGRTFEIGGSEVLTYVDMLKRLAVLEGRRLLVIAVPFLSPRLSSQWLSLVTDVDVPTGRALIDSMGNEVVVSGERNGGIREIADFTPMGYDDAALAALRERAMSHRERKERR